MVKITSVHFKNTNKYYSFDVNGLDIPENTDVIVETAQGMSFGTTVTEMQEIDDNEYEYELKPVLRIATDEDRKQLKENEELEDIAYVKCRDFIDELGLEMSLSNVEYAFDQSKITFNFTANKRVDFRELVKKLAAEFHRRIELRQIGARDETQLLGGLGICGRPFCCSTFLKNFHSVSIKMAKTQGLSLAPGKISGACGRLLCCLEYENEAYEDLNRTTPRKGAYVKCCGGCGKIVDRQLLTGLLKVQLDDSSDTAPPIVVPKEEVEVLRKPSHDEE